MSSSEPNSLGCRSKTSIPLSFSFPSLPRWSTFFFAFLAVITLIISPEDALQPPYLVSAVPTSSEEGSNFFNPGSPSDSELLGLSGPAKALLESLEPAKNFKVLLPQRLLSHPSAQNVLLTQAGLGEAVVDPDQDSLGDQIRLSFEAYNTKFEYFLDPIPGFTSLNDVHITVGDDISTSLDSFLKSSGEEILTYVCVLGKSPFSIVRITMQILSLVWYHISIFFIFSLIFFIFFSFFYFFSHFFRLFRFLSFSSFSSFFSHNRFRTRFNEEGGKGFAIATIFPDGSVEALIEHNRETFAVHGLPTNGILSSIPTTTPSPLGSLLTLREWISGLNLVKRLELRSSGDLLNPSDTSSLDRLRIRLGRLFTSLGATVPLELQTLFAEIFVRAKIGSVDAVTYKVDNILKQTGEQNGGSSADGTSTSMYSCSGTRRLRQASPPSLSTVKPLVEKLSKWQGCYPGDTKGLVFPVDIRVDVGFYRAVGETVGAVLSKISHTYASVNELYQSQLHIAFTPKNIVIKTQEDAEVR